MSAELLVFFVFAGLAVAGALNLVFQRHPIHSALSLILVMVSLAVLYLLLGAEFIAAIQIIVYAGAIMVLFLFVIMVLNAGEEEHTQMSRLARFVGLPLAAFFLLEATFFTYRAWPSGQVVVPGSFVGSAALLGRSLFSDYLLPFELTGILILIALLGAVVLAKKDS